MVTLTRPDGTRPEDVHLSRRGLTLALTGGYALAAWSAEAAPIKTDGAGLVQSMVQIKAPDREIPAFIARPAKSGKFPSVVLISEIFGLHEYIRDTARRLAKAGYAVIAPDFFVRAGDPSTMTDFPAIMKIVATATDAQVAGDVDAALAYLKAQPWADTNRAAITGFCWGGSVVWETVARRPDFKAGVAWYGRLASGMSQPDPGAKNPLDVVNELKAPVLGLYAEKDSGIPLTDVEKMKAALKAAGKSGSDIVVFPGAQHGFHADYRPSYNKEAADDGWARMLAFFKKNGV
ncbi:MAG: dienelactone hydrolase family protein [Phenylobacterium sp.]|uniref:dienelactone hydrolase family protein n=1 Tax=Phenylobacterium sp. TaxID=1871053 RepID=UPI0011F6A215|nr:dienelactone hydrolase family protein [Phenylobacterium sp.]TAJ71241.1 MAG: dienelactone hydrolase family protein [Phenylobacterium sp.]